MTNTDTSESALCDDPGRFVAPPGLKGVIVADTELGEVRGGEGFYHYRQFDAIGLARSATVEQVWQLLVDGSLHPAGSVETRRFASEIAAARHGATPRARVVDDIVAATTEYHAGLVALLPLVLGRATPSLDQRPAERRADAIALAAAVPTLLASLHAAQLGRTAPSPEPTLGHAADWLRMVTATPPSPTEVRLMETYLLATIDHGFNASTFATRVVTSTGADLASAFCAGVGALSGPLHGGAPGRALDMIRSIGDPVETEAWVTARLERGEKIMGFGHAVYRADDPRSLLLRDLVIEVASEVGGIDVVERAIEIERRTLAVLRRWKPESTIVTNVEFYAGVALHLAGLPAELFTASFMVSRAIGWSAHVLEQAAAGKIVRPSARYVGPPPVTIG